MFIKKGDPMPITIIKTGEMSGIEDNDTKKKLEEVIKKNKEIAVQKNTDTNN